MNGKFTLDLGRFIAKANGRMALVVRKVMFDIFSRVIYRTPVDEGTARGNWNCAISQMDFSTSNPPDPQGHAAVGRMSVVISDGVGSIVYLSNGLPYIDSLENGRILSDGSRTGPTSRQAPNGMLRLTVQQYPGIVQEAARGP